MDLATFENLVEKHEITCMVMQIYLDRMGYVTVTKKEYSKLEEVN